MLNTASLNMGMLVAMWTCGRSFCPKNKRWRVGGGRGVSSLLDGEDDGKKKLKSGKQRKGSQKVSYLDNVKIDIWTNPNLYSLIHFYLNRKRAWTILKVNFLFLFPLSYSHQRGSKPILSWIVVLSFLFLIYNLSNFNKGSKKKPIRMCINGTYLPKQDRARVLYLA